MKIMVFSLISFMLSQQNNNSVKVNPCQVGTKSLSDENSMPSDNLMPSWHKADKKSPQP